MPDSITDNGSQKEFFYSISEKEKDQRIDLFLASQQKTLTRSRIQSLIKDQFVKVNGFSVKSGNRLKLNDKVHFVLPPATPCEVIPEEVSFPVIFEDSWLIVIDKPPGLVIHPAPGHFNGTLVHGLLHRSSGLSGIGGVLRPGIVHRLDKDTSGLLVVAKNDSAHTGLSNQFKEGTVTKKYFALVHGIIPGQKGEIDLPISRHPVRRKEMAVSRSKGKRALTLWNKLETIGDKFSLLSVTLKTGRTHQIRVHLSHIGYPILGDPVYGLKKNWWNRQCPKALEVGLSINRQMLHSCLLGFIHPGTGKYCEFTSAMAEDMEKIILRLRQLFDEDKKN
jgi:23S rRNA pseudouridine1911/1915/1917 synthase